MLEQWCMDVHQRLAAALRPHVRDKAGGDADLAADAGVDLATLQRVLEGTEDYPVSALAAIADVLGLVLVLARKGRPDSATVPQVRTRVQAALGRIGDPSTG